MDSTFKTSFTAIECGKSNFMVRLLKNLPPMCDTVLKKNVWYFDEWQPLYSDLSLLKI